MPEIDTTGEPVVVQQGPLAEPGGLGRSVGPGVDRGSPPVWVGGRPGPAPRRAHGGRAGRAAVWRGPAEGLQPEAGLPRSWSTTGSRSASATATTPNANSLSPSPNATDSTARQGARPQPGEQHEHHPVPHLQAPTRSRPCSAAHEASPTKASATARSRRRVSATAGSCPASGSTHGWKELRVQRATGPRWRDGLRGQDPGGPLPGVLPRP